MVPSQKIALAILQRHPLAAATLHHLIVTLPHMKLCHYEGRLPRIRPQEQCDAFRGHPLEVLSLPPLQPDARLLPKLAARRREGTAVWRA